MQVNNVSRFGVGAVAVGAAGAIGAAGITVDQFGLIAVTAAAANLILTLPAPTLGNGAEIIILNDGANFFYLEGVAIRPGGMHAFYYLSGAWRSQSSMPTLQFTPIRFAVALTLTNAHHGHILEYTGAGAINVTAPNTLPVGFQCSLTQAGAGIFTIVGSGGMVVSNRWGGTKSAGQWAKVGFEVRAANSGVISGDVTT